MGNCEAQRRPPQQRAKTKTCGNPQAIANLRAALDDLSGEGRAELRDGISRHADADTARSLTQSLSDDAPSLVIPLLETEQILTLDLTDLERLIGGMDLAFTATIENLPNQPRGQNRDYGLRLWVLNIKELWTQTTDAPFTRDATDANEPITSAAIFCVNAFHIIEPDYPNSRILREMKDCIARQKPTGRIVSKNAQ